MNQINHNQDGQSSQKESVLRTLAIIGFIGLLIFIAWVGIKLVSFAPSAISSLASIADTVQNYDPDTRTPTELTVVSSKSIVNNAESVTISWSTPRREGTFVFSYPCTDGVAIDLRTASEGIRSLNCDVNYNIGSTNTVDLSISSERNRFTDVNYNVEFIPDGSEAPSGSYSGAITVINASISPVAIVDTDETDPTPENTDSPTTPSEPASESTSPNPPTPPTQPAPTYVQQYVYTIPVSDPNGTIDLAIRAIGVSTLDSVNRYTNSGFLNAGSRGALQIEVKNTGTKTSNSWDYTLTLPNGSVYEATEQKPLRPNERTVLTLGFNVPDTLSGTRNWTGSISTKADQTTSNNRFTATAQIR